MSEVSLAPSDPQAAISPAPAITTVPDGSGPIGLADGTPTDATGPATEATGADGWIDALAPAAPVDPARLADNGDQPHEASRYLNSRQTGEAVGASLSGP